MKKLTILLAVTSLLCGLALAGGNGAVKTDMVIHTDSAAYGEAGTVVGSANLNTTADGTLIVVVNLDDAAAPEDDEDTDPDEGIYDCRIWINGVPVDFVDCLKVNANGQGTTNVKVDLGALTIAEDATEINVNVVVRPYFLPQGETQTGKPCYVNGPSWKTDIPVPLK